MEVMPTSGKGTLGTWRFHFQRGRRTQSRPKPTHELELSYEQTIRSRGVCAPALKPRGEWEGSRTKCQGFKPDLGNSAVRHYRGAFENVAMVEMRTQLAIERAGLVTLHLRPARRSSIPTQAIPTAFPALVNPAVRALAIAKRWWLFWLLSHCSTGDRGRSFRAPFLVAPGLRHESAGREVVFRMCSIDADSAA